MELKNPCKECITYAICKYREIIQCNQLFKYIRETSEYPKKLLPNTKEIGSVEGNVFFAHIEKDYTIRFVKGSSWDKYY